MDSGPSKRLGASSHGIASRGNEHTKLAWNDKKRYIQAKFLKVGCPHLVEDGLVGTDEAPLEHLLLPVRVRHRVADVEQLGKENYIFTFKIVEKSLYINTSSKPDSRWPHQHSSRKISHHR